VIRRFAASRSGRVTIFVVNLALGVALLGFVLSRFGRPALSLLETQISVGGLLVFVASGGAALIALSRRWQGILASRTQPPGLGRMVLFRSAAHSLAVLVPSGKLGGDPLRIWFLHRCRVPLPSAIASVVIDRTQEIATVTPFSIAFASLLLLHEVPYVGDVIVTSVVAAASFAVAVVWALRRLREGKGVVTAMLRRMGADRARFIGAQMDSLDAAETEVVASVRARGQMVRSVMLGLLANLLVILEFAALLAAFDLPLSPVTVAAALFATGAAHLLPVPASIGVLEGAQIWIFQILGYPPDVGLAVGLAVRLRELLWMAPGLLLFVVPGFTPRLGSANGASRAGGPPPVRGGAAKEGRAVPPPEASRRGPGGS